MSADELPSRLSTPRRPVTDEYHGLQVTDDYRLLENSSNLMVREWTAAQNSHTRAWLDRLPALGPVYERLKELYTATSPDYFRLRYCGGVLFALKLQPPNEQAFLITLTSADDLDSEQVVVDPNQLDPTGGTSIDFYVPSLDGKLAAVCLSQGGSEDGAVHIYEVATGRKLPDLIPRVNYPTGGGSVAWNADRSGIYYTRYPHEGERPAEDLNFYQQVYFHKLGTPTSNDIYVIGQDFPRIAEIQLVTSDDGRYLLAGVANGDGGEFAHYLMNPAGQWTQITHFEDQIKQARLGPDDHLYLLSRKGVPGGRILRLLLAEPELGQARVVAEAGAAAIENFEPTLTWLYVVKVVGGPCEIQTYNQAGQLQAPVSIEPVASVGEVLRLQGDEILFRTTTFITPPAWYRYDPARGEAKRTKLFVTSPADFIDCEVMREFATSRDGTRVPLNIIRRKGTDLDGRNPVLLTGYGGFGISVSPFFSIRQRVWLDQGGVIVIANLRGGGEYGEEWHLAGNLTNKQNVFDDFAACAQYLIETRYTNPARLAFEGASNGGLLMGAVLTQHPALCRAVVSHVGLYDMLRVELDPNGAFNATEFGTVTQPHQFEALYDYSPYHRVVNGTAYPGILFVTGENDGRVNPAHSRKMAARLQVATSSKRPVLLRTSSTSGHGIGTALNEQIAEDADVFSFLFDQVEVDYWAGA